MDSQLNTTTYQKRSYTSLFLSRVVGIVQHMQISIYNAACKQKQGQNYIVISIDAEKSFVKIKHLFLIKALMKLRIIGIYLNIIKAMYNKSVANIILNVENLKS
jgi:hypothetical protein